METNLFIDIPKLEFTPGENVSGKILWALDKAPEEILLSLGWWTEGRGSKDAKIEEEMTWKTQLRAGEEKFSFTIPQSPYSFNGQLISLKWGLELSSKESREKHLLEIIVSPWGVAVDLPKVENESSRKSISFLRNR
jgi:hypothetical protein